jgi:hypothetical protein
VKIVDQLEDLACVLEGLTCSCEDPTLPQLPPELLTRLELTVGHVDKVLTTLTRELDAAFRARRLQRPRRRRRRAGRDVA